MGVRMVHVVLLGVRLDLDGAEEDIYKFYDNVKSDVCSLVSDGMSDDNIVYIGKVLRSSNDEEESFFDPTREGISMDNLARCQTEVKVELADKYNFRQYVTMGDIKIYIVTLWS